MLPPAPALFSTTNGTLYFVCICVARMRAKRSAEPPGPNGTTMLTCRAGQFSCACEKAVKLRTIEITLAKNARMANLRVNLNVTRPMVSFNMAHQPPPMRQAPGHTLWLSVQCPWSCTKTSDSLLSGTSDLQISRVLVTSIEVGIAMLNRRRVLKGGLVALGSLSVAPPYSARAQLKPLVKVRYNEVVRSILYAPA